MKRYLYTVLTVFFFGVLIYSISEAKGKKNMKSKENVSKVIYDLSINSLDGKRLIKMSEFIGKKVLCVNVASQCGYTPQYQGLQKLADTYPDKLVVIGFPCNQFGKQEPGNSEEIAAFCKKNYGVTFILTEKIEVKGTNQHPIYQWLTQQGLNGVSDATVKWNFNKFLIDEKGNWLSHFGSGTEPMSLDITSKL